MAEAESSMALRISATGPQAPPAAFVLEQGEVLLLGIMGWGGTDGRLGSASLPPLFLSSVIFN